MTASGTARYRKQPQSQVPSVGQSTDINVSFKGVPFLPLHFVIGVNATAPTTYAGFANPRVQTITEGDVGSLQWVCNGDGEYSGSAALNCAPREFDTAGDFLWIGFFHAASLVSGSVPDLVIGPATIGA